MADFNGTALTPTQAQGTTENPPLNLVSQATFVPARAFAGGAQQTFVMEARIISTTNYVRWRSEGSADATASLAFVQTGYTAVQLTDIKIAGLITR